jgi:pimeloyl-ACP methyl ester carboxylesterase
MARRLSIVLSLVLLAALPVAADAKVRKGPAGASFYTPPRALVPGAHGSLIWARRLTTAKAALEGGRGNRLLLYRSRGVTGKTAAVSGTLAVPKGRPPKGGWPLISWAHGTTGIADQCAPSRGAGSAPALLERWLKAGYAVVRTDYVGLGTPGDHPYLIGRPEGYSVLDAARAARKLDKRIGKRVVISGHSQGGQAALFAASLAPSYTSELKLRGTVAFAPASHLGEQSTLLPSFTQTGAFSGLVAMILRGLDIARPDLGIAGALSDQAAALYPQTLTECLDVLASRSSFGALAPSGMLRRGVDSGPSTAALGQLDDPEDLRITTPVRIQQGTADQVVFKPFTDPLVEDYKRRGNPVTYTTYEGVDHASIVTDGRSVKDATAYIRKRLR